MTESAANIGDEQWRAGLERVGFIVLAVLLSAAFFVLTMYICLLHSFVHYPTRETGVLKNEHASAMWWLSMMLACVAISIALASPLIRSIFRPPIEPKPRWLLIELPPEKTGAAKTGAAKTGTQKHGPSRTDPTGSQRAGP